jgi:hypothetical protein
MLSPDTLNLMPTNALASLSDFFSSKSESEAADLAAEEARKNRLNGQVEVSTSTGGKITTKQTNAGDSALKYAGFVATAASIAGLAKTLVDGGQEAYDPATLPPGTTADQATVDQMSAEVNDIPVMAPAGTASRAKEMELNSSASKVSALTQELSTTLQTLDQINSVITKRANGELPNPSVNVTLVSAAVEQIINTLESQGTLTAEQIALVRQTVEKSANLNLDSFEKFIEDRLVIPYADNAAALDIIKAQLLGTPDTVDTSAIFDTVYGPPVSSKGQYVLSEDGLYYDSRTGSIPYITAQKITSRSWELRYAANRGGQGQVFKSARVSEFADTVFSFDFEDESGSVKDFYKYDDILINLRNDRDLQVQDVSGKIHDLLALGYASDSAVIKNYKESYAGVAYTYDRKIKRRKKQLQIAALFGPFGVTLPTDPLGAGMFYRWVDKNDIKEPYYECGNSEKVEILDYKISEIATSAMYIPRIPVNDFSYLKEINFTPSIISQQELVLHSEDLDDTTNPLVPVFLKKGPGATFQAIPELAVGPMGTADWVNTSGDTGESSFTSGTLSGISPYLRTLDDAIVTDNLVICYNFLEPSAAGTPSSTNFGVRNYTDFGYPMNAKLVGDPATIFVSGVTIPYLRGSLYKPAVKYGARYSYLAEGSYVRLPNNYRDNAPYPASQPLDDIMYNPRGWSIEFWSHMGSDLSSNLTVDHRYKLIAANENCGETANVVGNQGYTLANDTFQGSTGQGKTRGMIVGWRDRGYPGTDPSGLEFVVCPTVSQNDTIWGKSVCIEEDVSGQGAGPACKIELGFKIPLSATTVSGYSIGQASGSFAHYNISCDSKLDVITLYVNGQFLASGTTSTLFGKDPGTPLSIPSRIGEDHYHDPYAMFGEKLYAGETPPSTPIFTPWILGGGFTDGIESSPFTTSLGTTFPGFLGTNTNSSYFSTGMDAGGGPRGQHSNLTAGIPGLGGYTKAGTDYKLARSGLDGHIGSFKMYSKPLSNLEVKTNYNAQSPYFQGIQLPKRLL